MVKPPKYVKKRNTNKDKAAQQHVEKKYLQSPLCLYLSLLRKKTSNLLGQAQRIALVFCRSYKFKQLLPCASGVQSRPSSCYLIFE
jgi:hypothetical protein